MDYQDFLASKDATTPRARGLHATCGVAAGAVVLILLLLNPMTNPQHFLLCMLAMAVFGGVFVGAAMSGRMRDALISLSDKRREIDVMANSKLVLEAQILEKRLSSRKRP
jgi:hypothetical protein